MSVVKHIKNLPAVKNPKKFMKGVSDMPGTIPDKILNGAERTAANVGRKIREPISNDRKLINESLGVNIPGLKDSAKGIAKTAVRKDKHGQNFGNAYTGYQEGGGMIAAAAVGGGLYAGFGSAYQIGMPEKPGETSYTGTAEIHNYDGVSSAPTLGASGDMVLGMHKGRKG